MMSQFFRSNKTIRFPLTLRLHQNPQIKHSIHSPFIKPALVSTQLEAKKVPTPTTQPLCKIPTDSSSKIGLEKKSSTGQKRLRTNYEDNYSASLALPLSDKELSANKNDQKALIQLSKDQILEHAARRVDLFFYLLIAYYNKDLVPIENHTVLQHGKGRQSSDKENVTQACHSSLFTSLVDVKSSDAKHSSKTNLLMGTHFFDSLNATVELPAEVNKLDDALEGKAGIRRKCLVIIKAVTKGLKNPIEGLTEFMIFMEKAFGDLETQRSLKKNRNLFLLTQSIFRPRTFRTDLIEIMKQGTFVNKWCLDTQTVTTDYIEMLLRLTAKEKKDCQRSQKKRKAIYSKKMEEIQLEILSTKSQSPDLMVRL